MIMFVRGDTVTYPYEPPVQQSVRWCTDEKRTERGCEQSLRLYISFAGFKDGQSG